jgi:hypothetical protein
MDLEFERALVSPRQGTYSQKGDIVVLCAYLGQLTEIRKQLANEVTTIMDERDLIALADKEEAALEQNTDDHQPQPSLAVQVEHAKVSQQVYAFRHSVWVLHINPHPQQSSAHC